jgi:methyl-accepting chemotaxis protein
MCHQELCSLTFRISCVNHENNSFSRSTHQDYQSSCASSDKSEGRESALEVPQEWDRQPVAWHPFPGSVEASKDDVLGLKASFTLLNSTIDDQAQKNKSAATQAALCLVVRTYGEGMTWFSSFKIHEDTITFLLPHFAFLAHADMTILAACSILAGAGLSILISGGISGRLQKILELAEKTASGQFDAAIDIDSDDEIGKVGAAIKKIIESQHNLAQAALKMAQGDMRVDIHLRSDSGCPGTSIAALPEKPPHG